MCKKSIWLAVLVALGLVSMAGVTYALPVNLVQNGSFEDDEVILNDPAWDKWCTWGNDVGTTSTVSFDTKEFADGKRSLRSAATELYLTILSRFPTEEEIAIVEAYGQAEETKGTKALLDLTWALFNSVEFLYRH